mmetsp:Transcript_38815/g.60514  ORF Transcript_38815/g.60514 Transcript_38815/m.60514 type:complete len:222 (+) Transcript_38815:605-1270(+)
MNYHVLVTQELDLVLFLRPGVNLQNLLSLKGNGIDALILFVVKPVLPLVLVHSNGMWIVGNKGAEVHLRDKDALSFFLPPISGRGHNFQNLVRVSRHTVNVTSPLTHDPSKVLILSITPVLRVRNHLWSSEECELPVALIAERVQPEPPVLMVRDGVNAPILGAVDTPVPTILVSNPLMLRSVAVDPPNLLGIWADLQHTIRLLWHAVDAIVFCQDPTKPL